MSQKNNRLGRGLKALYGDLGSISDLYGKTKEPEQDASADASSVDYFQDDYDKLKDPENSAQETVENLADDGDGEFGDYEMDYDSDDGDGDFGDYGEDLNHDDDSKSIFSDVNEIGNEPEDVISFNNLEGDHQHDSFNTQSFGTDIPDSGNQDTQDDLEKSSDDQIEDVYATPIDNDQEGESPQTEQATPSMSDGFQELSQQKDDEHVTSEPIPDFPQNPEPTQTPQQPKSIEEIQKEIQQQQVETKQDIPEEQHSDPLTSLRDRVKKSLGSSPFMSSNNNTTQNPTEIPQENPVESQKIPEEIPQESVQSAPDPVTTEPDLAPTPAEEVSQPQEPEYSSIEEAVNSYPIDDEPTFEKETPLEEEREPSYSLQEIPIQEEEPFIPEQKIPKLKASKPKLTPSDAFSSIEDGEFDGMGDFENLSNIDSKVTNVPNIFREISVEVIRPNPDQPRKEFDEDELQNLSDSIQSYGIIQPITVIRRTDDDDIYYEIISGERRFRAAVMANLHVVPCIVTERDGDIFEVALLENIQRQDLSIVEEAIAYQKIIEETSMTQDDLAKKVGKSRSHVSNCIRILGLSIDTLDAIVRKSVSFGHAKLLLSTKSAEDEKFLVDKIINEGTSVKELGKAIKSRNVREFFEIKHRPPESPQHSSQIVKEAIKEKVKAKEDNFSYHSKDDDLDVLDIPQTPFESMYKDVAGVLASKFKSDKLEFNIRNDIGRDSGKLIISFQNDKVLEKIVKILLNGEGN